MIASTSSLLIGPVDPWTPIPLADVVIVGSSWAASWGGSGGGTTGPGGATRPGGAGTGADVRVGGMAEGMMESEATGRELTWLPESNHEI